MKKKTDEEIIQEIIDAGYVAIEQLQKVALEEIDVKQVEPEKMKIVASTKKMAISDSFDILSMINENKNLLNNGDEQDPREGTQKSPQTARGIEDRLKK